MSSKLSLLGAIIFFIFFMYLKKKKIIEIEYFIIWILADFVLGLVSVFPNIVTIISTKLGIYFPHTIIVLSILLFGLLYNIYISVALSRQKRIIIKLSQEIVLIKNKNMEGKNG